MYSWYKYIILNNKPEKSNLFKNIHIKLLRLITAFTVLIRNMFAPLNEPNIANKGNRL